MAESNNNVLVTGFGPFGEHQVNASWEAVSALPDKIEGSNIIKLQIPVAYKHVEETIPLLWKQYNPKLVIHVGVSTITSEIQLESCANRTGYLRKDIEETCPDNGQACCNQSSNNQDCIKTDLCTKTICDRINKNPLLKASVSDDPGRYLCEFIYYVSLNQDSKRTLFVHVPPLNKPFSKSQLTLALEEIIRCALELLEEELEAGRQRQSSTSFLTNTAKIYRNGRAAAF